MNKLNDEDDEERYLNEYNKYALKYMLKREKDVSFIC